MRVFLDECVPIPLARRLDQFQVETAKSMGWEQVKNGSLLKLVEAEFDAFVTADQNMEYQQNLTGYNLAVVVLSTNNYRKLRGSIAEITITINSASVGQITRLTVS